MNKEVHTHSQLLQMARNVATQAYCPYSKFRVGVIVLANGKLYKGVNIENSSYGLTLCAERSALAAAISDGAKNITKVAISCIDAPQGIENDQMMPCGACRQWLSDLANDATIIIDGIDKEFKVSDILPFPFRLSG